MITEEWRIKPTPTDSIPEGAEVGIIEGDIFRDGKKREESSCPTK